MMKARLIYVVVVAAVVLAAVAGVSPAETKWKAGLKGGLNISQFRGDPVSPVVYRPTQQYYLTGRVGDPLAGVVLGGFFRREFNDRFALQLEALYSQKGGDGTVWGKFALTSPNVPQSITYDGDVNGTMTLRLDYIEFPLLAVFRFPAADKVGFTVQVGPSVGYNTRSEAQLEGQATVPLPDGSNRVLDFDTRIPISGQINPWEIAGVVGAALEFEMSSSIIVLEGRYTFGVTSIDKNNKDIYNHVFGITVAFMAPLKTD
jgi:hypothetical protein